MARLIIDAMNVIGTRPTGWWRDIDGAVRDLVERLAEFADATGHEITVVLDGRVPAGVDAPGLRIEAARRRGRNAADDRIVELVESDAHPATLTVVTSDRDLRARVQALGAQSAGPSSFLDQLDVV